MQQLYTEIGQHAKREREEKRTELDGLNKTWKSLKDAASKMDYSCKPFVRSRWWCEKCLKEDEANALKIGVHEWPLPQQTLQAQSVIFELSLPPAFSTWREITFTILRDIGMPNALKDADPKLLLDNYSGLSRWSTRHMFHRITIASTTKSFSDQTHYKHVQIPADVGDVLLNNGLSFGLFDRTSSSWAAGLFESNITDTCTPPIPVSTPYSKIHHTVSGTCHTSNEVIAAQADCPLELSLHEYMAFAGLRSGPCLQWLNVAREIPSPSLSFRHEEVHTLITQAAWQIGPLSDNAGVREWHIDLGHSSFGKTLLQELEALLRKIKANWQEEVTVRTIGT